MCKARQRHGRHVQTNTKPAKVRRRRMGSRRPIVPATRALNRLADEYAKSDCWLAQHARAPSRHALGCRVKTRGGALGGVVVSGGALTEELSTAVGVALPVITCAVKFRSCDGKFFFFFSGISCLVYLLIRGHAALRYTGRLTVEGPRGASRCGERCAQHVGLAAVWRRSDFFARALFA